MLKSAPKMEFGVCLKDIGAFGVEQNQMILKSRVSRGLWDWKYIMMVPKELVPWSTEVE